LYRSAHEEEGEGAEEGVEADEKDA
jgi:hypothetical protein